MEDRLESAEDRLEIDELIVRAFVIAGLLVWSAATVGAYASGQTDAFYGYGALATFVAAVLVIGWFYERIAAMLLVIAAGAIVAWGILGAWELGVWLMVGAMLIAPVLAAAVMYSFAEYEEEVIERAQHSVPTTVAHA